MSDVENEPKPLSAAQRQKYLEKTAMAEERMRIAAEKITLRLIDTAVELQTRGDAFPNTAEGWHSAARLGEEGITLSYLERYVIYVKRTSPSAPEWKLLAKLGLFEQEYVKLARQNRIIRIVLGRGARPGLDTVTKLFDAYGEIFLKYQIDRACLYARAYTDEFRPLFEAKGIHIGRREGRSARPMEDYWAGRKRRRVAHLLKLLEEFPPLIGLKKWCGEYAETEVEIEIGGRKEKNTFETLELNYKRIRSMIEPNSKILVPELREAFIAKKVIGDGKKLADPANKGKRYLAKDMAWMHEVYLLKGRVAEEVMRLPYEGGTAPRKWLMKSRRKNVMGLGMGKLEVGPKLLGRILNDRKNFPHMQEAYDRMAKRAGEAKARRHSGRKNSHENHFPHSVAEQYCRCLSLLAQWQYGKKAGGKLAPDAGQSRPAGMQNPPPDAHAEQPADAVAAEKPSFASFFRMSGERLAQICTTQESLGILAFKSSDKYVKMVANALSKCGFDVAREEKLWQVGNIVEGVLKDKRWENKDENYIADLMQFAIPQRLQIGIRKNEDFLGYALDKNGRARRLLEEFNFIGKDGNLRVRENPVQKIAVEQNTVKDEMKTDTGAAVEAITRQKSIQAGTDNLSPKEKWDSRVQRFNDMNIRVRKTGGIITKS